MSELEDKDRKLQIADATPEDAEGIVAVQKAAWLATYPNDELDITLEDIREQTKNFSAERMLQRLSNPDPNRHYWVAKDGDKVVGMHLVLRGEEENTLQALYVHPGFQRLGVGSRLMQIALDWLGNEKDIILGVVTYNKNAIDFYKKFGFVENGERHDEVATLPSGKVMPEIEMVKRKH